MKKWILLAASGLMLASCENKEKKIPDKDRRQTSEEHIKASDSFNATPDKRNICYEQAPRAITIPLNSNRRMIRE